MVVMQATKKLFDENHFSICTVRKIAEIIGAPQSGPAWKMLDALHCINYADMPQDLRESIPHLVNECLRANQKSIDSTITALEGVQV